MVNEEATYVKIAYDIANKIVDGEFPEGSILKGRSLLASIYKVSPETIRKSVNLLAQEKILYVKHGVGVFVDSAVKAQQYLSSFNKQATIEDKTNDIYKLLEEANEINKKLALSFKTLEQEFKFKANESIEFYELEIDEDSWLCNKTPGEVYFWNYTEATIVAIKKPNILLVSPGPDIAFDAHDKIIFVGKDNLTYERVVTFMKYGVEE